MADVKTTLDISDVVAKSAQLDALLKAQARQFGDVTSAQLKFNAAGIETGATIESVNNKGQKVVTTFESMRDIFGRLTGQLGETGRTFDYMGDRAQKAFLKMVPSPTLKSGLDGIHTSFERAMNVATRFGQYRALNFATSETGDAIKSARDYQIQVSLIRTISQEAQLSTSQWANGISNLSSKLGIEFKDVASAAYDAVSNQIAQGANTFRFLENAGNLARITGSSMKDSGNILANIINTFGSSAGTQEQVVAKLFTLQDRGRIVLSEIANTYGRVAFTAQAAGVSMDEVNGAIALMTRSGVTGDDAITLLNNVMTHFLKPSEDMKKHLDAIGIGANANIFKIKGFTGAIQVMADAVASGAADTQKLFPDIRANRAFGFLQGRTGELQNEINIQGDGAAEERAARALAIRAESSADKINKALITFQNSLTQSIGNGVNSLLQKSIERISGVELSSAVNDQQQLKKAIDDTIQSVVQSAKVVATLVLGYKAFGLTLGLAKIATEALAYASQRKLAIDEILRAKASQNIAMTRAQAIEEIRLGQARQFAAGGGGTIAKASPLVGIGIFAATAIASYTAFKEVSTDAFSTVGNAMDEYRKKLDQLDVDKKFIKNVDGAKALQQVLEKISRGTLNGLTKELQDANKELETTKSKVNDTGDVIKNKMVAYFDLVRNSIQRAEEEVKRLQTRMDGSGKFKGGLGDRITDAVSKFQGQGADDITGINLVEQRIKKMQAKVAALYAKGDADSLQEGRKLNEQLVDLIAERYSKIQELSNKNQAAAANDPNALQGAGFSGKVDPTALARDLAKHEAWAGSLEDIAIAADKAKVAQLQLNIAEQKVAEDRAKNAIKKYESFSIYDKGNNVKEEFKTTGKLDLDKAKAGLQKAKDELDASLNKDVLKTLDGQGGLSLTKSLQQHSDNLADMFAAIEKQKALEIAQNEVVKSTESVTKAQQASTTAAEKWGEGITAVTAKAEAFATSLGKVNEGMGELTSKGLNQKEGSSLLGAFGRGLGIFGGHIAGGLGVDEAGNQANKDEQDIKDKIAAVVKRIQDSPKKTVTKFGKVMPDIGETRGIQQDLLVIQNTLAARASDLGQKLSGGGINADVAKPLEAKLTELQKLIRDFEGLENDLKKLEVEQAANEKLLTASANAEKLSLEVKSADDAFSAMFGGIAAGVDNTAKPKIQELEKALEDLKNAAGLVVPGAEPKRQAYGGPIGSDNQMIYAKAGEIVSTQEASNSFYSQIMAMNATARTPQYFSGGGQVGGPVTVNVNESKTPRMTGREVERVFKRHQRQQGKRR